MPGDLIAASPLAFEFLSLFSVEAKHHKNIYLEQYLIYAEGRSNLSRIIAQARKQAEAVGLNYLVVTKQNGLEAFVLMPHHIGKVAVLTSSLRRGLRPIRMHMLHNDTVAMTTLSDFLTLNPTVFLQMVRGNDPNSRLAS